jgi:LmbE family N-acetylglucosaminyl deacetylase
MPTKTSHDGFIVLFLFAHQDDEFGVFPSIKASLHNGPVVCVYFTDGGNPILRNAESLAVLQKLGVSRENVHFVGQELNIPDGQLHNHLMGIALWLEACLAAHPKLAKIYVPAWEGGHPDHDALHAVTVGTLHAHGMSSSIRQYSLYNARRCIGPFFRVFAPIMENGSVTQYQIAWSDRLRFLAYCLQYPSQKKTWFGLFPFVLLHMVLCGCQNLQFVDVNRIFERPHKKPLYYEKRGFLTWDCLKEAIISWHKEFESRRICQNDLIFSESPLRPLYEGGKGHESQK